MRLLTLTACGLLTSLLLSSCDIGLFCDADDHFSLEAVASQDLEVSLEAGGSGQYLDITNWLGLA